MTLGRFCPRLAPTLSTFTIVLVCIALGVWQLQRLHWKEGLIAQRESALSAPPIAPPHTLADARRLEFRRVAATGRLLHDKEILLHAIGPKGEAGFRVLTPLLQPEGSLVLVDRGFVPTELTDPARRIAGQVAGTVRVTGLLRLAPPVKPGWFIPDNRPAPGRGGTGPGPGEWFWLDLDAIAEADRLGPIAPYYIMADPLPDAGPWPQSEAALPSLPNNHLQYAITWFSLAAAAMVIYFLSQRSGGGGGANGGIRRS